MVPDVQHVKNKLDRIQVSLVGEFYRTRTKKHTISLPNFIYQIIVKTSWQKEETII